MIPAFTKFGAINFGREVDGTPVHEATEMFTFSGIRWCSYCEEYGWLDCGKKSKDEYFHIGQLLKMCIGYEYVFVL